MYYIMFERKLHHKGVHEPVDIPGSETVIVNHFGDYDKSFELYTLEGEIAEVTEVYLKIQEKFEGYIKYITEGETYSPFASGSNWLWKQYIHRQGAQYIPSASL